MNGAPSDEIVWRYLTFPKFLAMLEFGALWMSRLQILQDRFEGTLPYATRVGMIKGDLKWRESFRQPELQAQLTTMTDRNVEDGRDVLLVNCWFSGEHESERMWAEYSNQTEGIAIRSTLTRLESSIVAKQEFTRVGKVRYVDFSTHDMGVYAGHQAHERALIKQVEYSHECEIRIITMNLVCPGCLNIDGSPPTPSQLSGPGMFDPNRPGLYLRVDLNTLIQKVVTAPRAADWFYNLVAKLCKRYGVQCTPEASSLVQ